MIKLTFCLVRLPSLTREQFQDYWFNTHAPLVKSHREVLGIRRYVQLHSAEAALSVDLRQSRGGPEQYDGVAELWCRVIFLWSGLMERQMAHQPNPRSPASSSRVRKRDGERQN